MEKETLTWLTTSEALELLKIKSRTTLYYFLKKYEIRISKPLHRTYIAKEDLEQAIYNLAIKISIN